MKPKNDLFELIKSLSKNEKRYFRIYAGMQRGNKSYLKLFNEIEKQKQYDEGILKMEFAGFGRKGKMAFTKFYLYNLIMKSLISFNQKNSPDIKIQSMISECRILFDKALYGKYFRKIEEARKLALKYERYGYLLQIIDLEKVIIKKELLQSEKTRLLYEEVQRTLINAGQIFSNSHITSRLLSKYRSYGITRGKDFDRKIEEIVNSPGLVKAEHAGSFRAKEAYFRVKEIQALVSAEYGKMLQALEKRLEMINTCPEAFEDLIIDYRIDVLYSLVDTCLLLKKHEEAEKYLTMLETHNTNRAAVKNDNIIIISYARFRLLLKQDKIREAVEQIPSLEKILIFYKNKILLDIELGIMFQILNCRILSGNYSEALKMQNRLASHPLLEKRKDFETYLKIINLIIHYEMKNYELLKHLIISVYRYLNKRNKLFRLEQLILEFIRMLPKVKNEHDLEFLFGKYTKRLRALSKDKYERNAFEYFDYLKWIESKIQ